MRQPTSPDVTPAEIIEPFGKETQTFVIIHYEYLVTRHRPSVITITYGLT